MSGGTVVPLWAAPLGGVAPTGAVPNGKAGGAEGDGGGVVPLPPGDVVGGDPAGE
ncbi:hypothetical protein [Streptomyces sp. CB00455]|uniref:hypothetical protein n=1 Tax=Streptomyces sp. CB00455 TaxID=1703927 RepID=UPI000A9EE683|nr:hypothetical protein [Streptomyces sp. CB00455]